MAHKVIMYCGNYENFQAMFSTQQLRTKGASDLVIVDQTTETGQQMVAKGENIQKMLLAEPKEVLRIFCNNEHFLNGLRLAVHDNRIESENVQILYVNDDAKAPYDLRSILVKPNGRLTTWPVGFFDAIEIALAKLIKH